MTSSDPGEAEQSSNIQLVNHVGPAQLSAALSEEPGKRNSFYFTSPPAAAEQNSNKISRIM